MSTEALNWAFAQELPTARKFVLVVLADHADQAHSCFPSITRICERTSLSRSSVQVAIKALVEEGLVSVQRRQRPNGSDTSSRYYLTAPNPMVDDAEPETEGARELGGGGPTAGPPPARQLGPHNHHKEPPVKSLSEIAAEDRFEDAWLSWPNKNAKAKAKAKFLALVKANPSMLASLFEAVVAHGNAYAESGRQVQHIPHLLTWLNGSRWEDPLPERQDNRGNQRDAAAADVLSHFRGR